MAWLAAGPQLLDIIAACAYLATALQPWIAVILLVTLISYIPLTVYLTEWRGRFRRCVHGLVLPAAACGRCACRGCRCLCQGILALP